MMPVRTRLLHLPGEEDRLAELRRFGYSSPEAVTREKLLTPSRLILISGLSSAAIRQIDAETAVGYRCHLFELPSSGICGPRALLTAGDSELGRLSKWASGQGDDLAGFASSLRRLLEHLLKRPRRLLGAGCELLLDRPRIMGILNVTPDSFSDGGMHNSLDAARRRAAEMAEEGADLIDVGGESTRPGAPPVDQDEELRRVLPVVKALQADLGLPLSVDTTKSAVARAALEAGANFINDISGLAFDPEIASVVAQSGAGLFLMHMRGTPSNMQKDTGYEDLLGEVQEFLEGSLIQAEERGVSRENLAIDPGLGFGKSLEGNLEILRRIPELQGLGRPILIGASRKSFIGRILGQSDPHSRLCGSLAAVAVGVDRGGQIFRVHDVGPSREAALMAWSICQSGGGANPLT